MLLLSRLSLLFYNKATDRDRLVSGVRERERERERGKREERGFCNGVLFLAGKAVSEVGAVSRSTL